jgi:arabinogalactan oligomer/maltooligosaccharide transport system permease protein
MTVINNVKSMIMEEFSGIDKGFIRDVGKNVKHSVSTKYWNLAMEKYLPGAGLTEERAPIGLIIVYCASSAMGYYVSKGFFDTIPKSLDEAARVDGATRLQVFYKVIMPLSKPIIIYTILIGFMAPWGDFMLSSYLIHENSEGMNVAVGMYKWLAKTNMNDHYTMFCAAGVVVAVPVTSVFLMLQKYYVEGVTGGAVKG